MKPHRFKVGDKVRLRSEFISHFKMGTGVGVVVGYDNFESYILVTYGKTDMGREFPFYPKEIEHVSKKGQQLVFPFMKE